MGIFIFHVEPTFPLRQKCVPNQVWRGPASVNEITSQNLWPRIISNPFIIQNRAKRSCKNLRGALFSFVASAAKFWKRDISSASERVFPGFVGHFFGCSIPSKRGVSVHKNSLAFCQRCRQSVEPRALMCPFKQRNLSAWSRCFQYTILELKWCCAICISKDLIWPSVCYLTLSSLPLGTNCVVENIQYWSSNYFHH